MFDTVIIRECSLTSRVQVYTDGLTRNVERFRCSRYGWRAELMVIGGVEELHFVILLFQHDLQKYVMKNLKLACCVCCNYKVGRYLKKSNGGTRHNCNVWTSFIVLKNMPCAY